MIIIENLDNCLYFELYIDFTDICKYNKSTRRTESFEQEYSFDDIDSLFHLNGKISEQDKLDIEAKLNNAFEKTIGKIVTDELCTDGYLTLSALHGSGKDRASDTDKSLFSFSYYYELESTTQLENVSPVLDKRLSRVKLKMSTHLTEKQQLDLFGSGTKVTWFYLRFPSMTENLIREYLSSVNDEYIKLINIIKNSGKQYEKYEDIPKEIRDELERLQQQMIT